MNIQAETITINGIDYVRAKYPTPRFYLHPISQREHYLVTREWIRTGIARAKRWGHKDKPTQFRFRMTEGRTWWDFV